MQVVRRQFQRADSLLLKTAERQIVFNNDLSSPHQRTGRSHGPDFGSETEPARGHSSRQTKQTFATFLR